MEQSLIVYGTLEKEESAREAALVLQQSVRRREHNIKPQILKDTEVTEEDLKTHHLLLIGRPTTNSIIRRFQNSLPAILGVVSQFEQDTLFYTQVMLLTFDREEDGLVATTASLVYEVR